jgi:23S rRNA G2445 N2-methylase RlmL
MTPFFALTFRGLEAVCAREIASIPGVRVESVSYRRVTGEIDGPLDPLLGLRTADDLFLYADTWSPLPTQRTALADLPYWVNMLDLYALGGLIDGVRKRTNKPPMISVTASFVGKRNYTTQEIKDAVGPAIESGFGWTYTDDDRSADLNLRLFIEHDSAVVGLRLPKSPLHDRPYTQTRQPGALKPPVAAAMVLLADLTDGGAVIDPCCGSGTILLEAAALGMKPVGGDIDPAALALSRQGAESVGLSLPLNQWDMRHLPLASASVEAVIGNLPWGQQVEVTGDLDAFYIDACCEIERVIAPGGSVVLLTSEPQRIAFERLQIAQTVEISLFGQTPTIVVAK